MKNLDLVEKDYFGLQFMDTHQVGHWLDPTKKIKKQVKIGPPYTLHFRVKFYAAEPHELGEELTRYHFFLQVKQDIARNKLEVPQRTAVDLAAYSLQSQLGDYDAELHGDDYMAEFKFFPDQNRELEVQIRKKHKALVGLNPAECEVNFLRIVKGMDFYGVNLHSVVDQHKIEYELGLTPRGILVAREKKKVGLHYWPRIAKMTFKKKNYLLDVQEEDRQVHSYIYTLSSAQAAKHLWKCAVEHHTFFRLVKPANKPKRTSSFLRFGSRFRYSGRTEYQTQKDSRLSARKSLKFKRATSERFTKRSTIGYIRVGSRVWGKALNGDFYRGMVTGVGQMVHIKFDNGDTIAHDRSDPECVVFDKDPDPQEIQFGTRVIAHWPTLPAYLSGKVIGIDPHKYYVEYDDGDKHHNTIQQMRILKPPLYFGPGTNARKIKKSESMKVTSLTGRAVITTELPKPDKSNGAPKTSTVSMETPATVAQATVAAKSDDDRNQPETTFARSTSLPATVRAPPEGSFDEKQKKARNKSSAGTSKQKAPLDVFSLPETDIDSGITVACEASKGTRRNIHTFDMTGKDTARGVARSNPETMRAYRTGSPTAQLIVPRNAPFAPNFQEDSGDKGSSRAYRNLDAQRAFHVFVPRASRASRDHSKRLTYIPTMSYHAVHRYRKRTSLPDLREFLEQEEAEKQAKRNIEGSPKALNRTASLNDLAKASPESSRQTPLSMDNLGINTSPVDNDAPVTNWPPQEPHYQPTSATTRSMFVTDL
ncbi:uncharacterized protein LOC5514796 isoform X2 [Nematostella vectensis]|nr:uncharacterized protein LOC5514796 isoform X2 [Nematostella vectensis]